MYQAFGHSTENNKYDFVCYQKNHQLIRILNRDKNAVKASILLKFNSNDSILLSIKNFSLIQLAANENALGQLTKSSEFAELGKQD